MNHQNRFSFQEVEFFIKIILVLINDVLVGRRMKYFKC